MSIKKQTGTTGTARRGPSPETVKIEGDWESAVRKALKKKRPAEGWPERETQKRKKKTEKR
jgi:translation initiation factor 1 (eIF-1/SUI1)